ncbi:MAG TPA: hypothetical protein PK052_02895 [Anaerohalosphaeraceae bacterium]|nr:hypothetical protein [Phycisphaerae bacterium]HOK94648.1 hypothetical protein [Anaerohalosphaeraceae bacterium]HOL30905.1 hypothetical protein [Anaerohalosphaeraceae bacterium]HOM75680.1 hypothetical protein [Anaerohalosphaeraceae bacterium]HPC64221.1 hypothetical protein [Anaerohalosphaeraceae bacterium]
MHKQLIEEVAAIYRRLDEQTAPLAGGCTACGECCDFERFGHRLYVTTPELLYFGYFARQPIQEMNGGICPYRISGKCSVYPYRFSGCRIFQCRQDSQQQQNTISEQTVRQLKTLCTHYSIPYHYVYLQAGLKMLRTGMLPEQL